MGPSDLQNCVPGFSSFRPLLQYLQIDFSLSFYSLIWTKGSMVHWVSCLQLHLSQLSAQDLQADSLAS